MAIPSSSSLSSLKAEASQKGVVREVGDDRMSRHMVVPEGVTRLGTSGLGANEKEGVVDLDSSSPCIGSNISIRDSC